MIIILKDIPQEPGNMVLCNVDYILIATTTVEQHLEKFFNTISCTPRPISGAGSSEMEKSSPIPRNTAGWRNGSHSKRRNTYRAYGLFFLSLLSLLSSLQSFLFSQWENVGEVVMTPTFGNRSRRRTYYMIVACTQSHEVE